VRHLRILGLALVAIFAMAALGAGSASAAELSYSTCVKAAKSGKTYTGKYNDKACTEVNSKSEGKYEAQAAPEEAAFTGKSKAVVITAAGKTVTCKKGTNAGTLTTERFGTDQFTLSGCAVSKPEPCETPSAGAGIIKTSVLHTGLVWLNAGESQIGMLLTSSGGPVATFKCGATTIALKGRVLAQVANTKKGQTLTFAVSGGKQAQQTFFLEEEEFGPFTLFTENLAEEEVEATLSLTDEQGPKGVAAV
jgi:hypothetical protein